MSRKRPLITRQSIKKKLRSQAFPQVLAPRTSTKKIQKAPRLARGRTAAARATVSVQTFDMGDMVWAKLGSCPWWPGLVVNAEDVGVSKFSKPNQSWIFWFGDHRVSQVPNSSLRHFARGFLELWSPTLEKKGRKKGILEAVQLYAQRVNNLPMADAPADHLVEWAKNYFTVPENVNSQTSDVIPSFVMEKMLQIKQMNMKLEKRATKTVLSILPRVERLKNLTDTCMACRRRDVIVVAKHPLFLGQLCSVCMELLKQNFFEESMFCAVCARSCNISFPCCSVECGRVFCTICIACLAAPEATENLDSKESWLCFLCEEQPEIQGLLLTDSQWQENIMQLYKPSITTSTHVPMSIENKRPLRVLSLFDGIGTGLFVLDALNLQVEVYFASEINKDALNVTKLNFNGRINYIGDVTRITEEDLERMSPIDLLLGGSPCNELSIVNPARKGIYDPNGTGILFFDYVRILNFLEREADEAHPLFWLFENVAALPYTTRSTISRFFGQEPSLLDSKHYSAMHRARFFWGNIPGLEIAGLHAPEKGPTVTNYLIPGCGRVQAVEKIRTVTTKRNSLLQGQSLIRPVIMDGECDGLWITELEAIFGFPRHYTDVGNLSVHHRQQLLGRAWSVPVVKKILRPLKNFFKEK